MLKLDLEFEDFDENKVTESFYFHLSKAEISEWVITHDGDLREYIEKILETEDKREIMRMFKEIVANSVGRQSEDRRRFVKSKEITDDFMQSGAYDEFFMRLFSEPGFGSQFINGIMPKGMTQSMVEVELPKEAPTKNFMEYTYKDFLEMPEDQFQELQKKNSHNLTKTFLQAALNRANRIS